jgi:hypothetical protein
MGRAAKQAEFARKRGDTLTLFQKFALAGVPKGWWLTLSQFDGQITCFPGKPWQGEPLIRFPKNH